MIQQTALKCELSTVHLWKSFTGHLIGLVWQYAVDTPCHNWEDPDSSQKNKHSDPIEDVCVHDKSFHKDPICEKQKMDIKHRHYPAQWKSCPCFLRLLYVMIQRISSTTMDHYHEYH